MGVPLPPLLLPSPPQKIKFYIYGPILLKYETEHFHMFTNNDLV